MNSVQDRSAGSFRILLIDGHALRRTALQRFLQSLGDEEGIAVEVSHAASVEEAGALAKAARVAMIGAGSVTEAIMQLGGVRAAAPALPVAVLSDTETSAEVVMALEAGAQGVISTRIDPGLMLHALRFLAVGGHFFPPGALLDDGEDGAAVPSHHCANGAAAAMSAPAMGGLTSRQHEVLRLLQEGQSNKRIARSLGLRESTIKVHVRQIMRKLGVANRTQAALTTLKVPANDDRLAAA